jgi:dipeptidyl aminopeptidase/acylaminoacyl peptidase
MDGSPFEVPERYRRHSPFVFADRIEAPLLLLHGRDDEQVPLSQGVLMFQALRRLGRTTEMVIYDGADHSIVRGSRRYYSDYYTRTLDWWDKYLKETRQ